MHYKDGTPVSVGDQVKVDGDMTGRVVAVIDQGQFASDYPAEQWNYLAVGILIESVQAGLVHYPNPGVDIDLVERQAAPAHQ